MKSTLSYQELEAGLGESLRSLRLQRNIDQKTLGERAGLSLTAIKNLESGKGASIKTLVRVAKALGVQDWLLAVAPRITVNPLHMVKGASERQRARSSKSKKDQSR